MRTFFLGVIAVAVSLCATPRPLFAADEGATKYSAAVRRLMQAEHAGPFKVWIYFTDHNEHAGSPVSAQLSRVALSDRAKARRINRSRAPLVDMHDLPVSRRYIERVKATGCIVKKPSKYFNSVSALATGEQIASIARLQFVRKIDKVASFRRKPLPATPLQPYRDDAPARADSRLAADPEYGPSFGQLDQINVIPLHESGNHGEGVLVAMLDTGFNLRHLSLNHVDVIAEWDFIQNDSITENEYGDASTQHNHGTYTLSALGGYAPGALIGPAWGASFVLAKTERVLTEVIQEEDDWVRGVEWADSIGADLVSSSLGYYDWYTYADMDGNTAITTRAADIAAGKGMAIVTAAGNEGTLPWPGIIAPSDGDSVIAVGAVDSFGVVASFSSRGPSYDGRIKPDVMAQGVSVVSAAAWDSLGFVRVNGTSLSTPLVAGVCALLLKMHPQWTPVDLLDALRGSASRSDTPDNNYGWGIINAYVSALNGSTGVESAFFEHEVLAGAVRLTVYTPGVDTGSFDLLRRRRLASDGSAWTPFAAVVESFTANSYEPFVFTDTGVSAGVYRYRLQSSANPAVYKDMGVDVLIPWSFSLQQNFPNPFTPSTSGHTDIRFTLGGTPAATGLSPALSEYRDVSLDIYDVTGALVRSLYSGLRSPGEYRIPWDGTDDRNRMVAPGVYYYRLRVDGASTTRKIVVINR